ELRLAFRDHDRIDLDIIHLVRFPEVIDQRTRAQEIQGTQTISLTNGMDAQRMNAKNRGRGERRDNHFDEVCVTYSSWIIMIPMDREDRKRDLDIRILVVR